MAGVVRVGSIGSITVRNMCRGKTGGNSCLPELWVIQVEENPAYNRLEEQRKLIDYLRRRLRCKIVATINITS